MNILDNGIQVNGVSEDIELNSNYFKEFEFQVNKKIDFEIKNILSINSKINIGEADIIKTPMMISYEGLYLSGYKLKVELIIDMCIKYMLKESINILQVTRSKAIKVVDIVLPLEHKGINMVDLLRRKKIITKAYIEDIYGEIRDINTLYTNLSAIVVAEFDNV